MKNNTQMLIERCIERCMEKIDNATSNCRDSYIKYVFGELSLKTRIWIQCKAMKILLKSYEDYLKNNWVEDVDDFIHKLEENEE